MQTATPHFDTEHLAAVAHRRAGELFATRGTQEYERLGNARDTEKATDRPRGPTQCLTSLELALFRRERGEEGREDQRRGITTRSYRLWQVQINDDDGCTATGRTNECEKRRYGPEGGESVR